jgi:hypothetical protein
MKCLGNRAHDTLGGLPSIWCMDRALHGVPSAYRLLGHAQPPAKLSHTCLCIAFIAYRIIF